MIRSTRLPFTYPSGDSQLWLEKSRLQNIFSSYYLHAAAQGINLNHCIIKQRSCYQETYAVIKRDEMITLEKESTRSYIQTNFSYVVTPVHIWAVPSQRSILVPRISLKPSFPRHSPWGNTFLCAHVQPAAVRSQCEVSALPSVYSAVSFSCQQGAGVSHKTAASQRILSCTNVLQS